MEIKQYTKSLQMFKDWYTEEVIKKDYEIRKEEILRVDPTQKVPDFKKPEIPDNVAEQLVMSLGNMILYFLDSKEMFISTTWNSKTSKFYCTINNDILDTEYSTRIECESKAIQECFKLLNEK